MHEVLQWPVVGLLFTVSCLWPHGIVTLTTGVTPCVTSVMLFLYAHKICNVFMFWAFVLLLYCIDLTPLHFPIFGCHFCVTPTTKFNTEKWIMRFFKIYCWCCFIGQWVISSWRKIWSMIWLISWLCVSYHQSWLTQNWPALWRDPYIQFSSPIWCWGHNIWENEVNTIALDASVPFATRWSAAMILTVRNGYVLVFLGSKSLQPVM